MHKRWLLVGASVITLVVMAVLLSSRWLYTLPFMPARWRDNFRLNANILPASDDARAQYIAINPGFRAEFGDKENPTSAYLRFEKTTTAASTNADVDRNLLDSLAIVQLTKDYQPGVEWQLFNVGIDESQLDGGTLLADDEEILQITRQLLADDVAAPTTTDLETVAAAREQITTETVVTRFQGYDQVDNRAVADDVDLRYTVAPGRGIRSEIVIGDRQNFDTACLKLLSLTGSDAGCNLPSNKFSFLLQLDDGQRLEHTPLALDESTGGTYFVADRDGRYLLRLGNPLLTDAAGQTSDTVTFEVRPGQVGGETIANYYIVTVTANLGWLIDAQREFPVTISGGFYIDGAELFATIPNDGTASLDGTTPMDSNYLTESIEASATADQH